MAEGKKKEKREKGSALYTVKRQTLTKFTLTKSSSKINGFIVPL